MDRASAQRRATARRVNIAGYRVTDDHGDRLRVQARAVLSAEPNIVPDVAIGLDRLCRAAVASSASTRSRVTLMTTAGSSVLVGFGGPPRPGHPGAPVRPRRGPRPRRVRRGPTGAHPRPAGQQRSLARLRRRRDRARHRGRLRLPGAARGGSLRRLTCVTGRSGPLGQRELSAGLIFAEVATELLLDSSPTGDHPDPQLHAAIHVHDEVYQAQGMVMVDLACRSTWPWLGCAPWPSPRASRFKNSPPTSSRVDALSSGTDDP